MLTHPLRYFVLSVIFMALFAFYNGDLPPEFQRFLGIEAQQALPTHAANIILTEKRTQHILYGDGRGGGHKHGVGTPCKSEFPADWDDEKIINTTKRIAANNNLSWEQQDNGYYVAETFEDEIKVRVVLGDQRQRVITSYPTNVARNPCSPKGPANDR